MSRLISSTTFATLLVAVAGTFAGCASDSSSASYAAGSYDTSAAAQPAAVSVPGVRRTATAVDGINAVTTELTGVRQNVEDTLASLAALSSVQGDLLAPFQRFISLREQVDAADKRLADRGEDMRDRARDYITNWEVEVYGVEDPNLRQQAEVRRNEVRENFGRITDSARALRESMEPFRRQLSDLQTFLGNDLTAHGVRAAGPSIDQATQSGREVQRRIDTLVGELNRVANAMTPAVTQPAPANTEAAK